MENADPKKETGPVGGFFKTIMMMMGKFWWAFPVVLVGLGYLAAPLRATVGTSIDPDLFKWLFISLVPCGIWLGATFMVVTNGDTSVSHLKSNAFVSGVLAIGFSMVSAFLTAKNQLPWVMVLPTITAIIDSLITNDRGINNAALKPIVQQQNSKS